MDREEAFSVEPLRRPDSSVPRVIWIGVIWFAVAAIAIALTMGPLLASGWRPTKLPGWDQWLWWVGAGATAVSLPFIGWSGCPILAKDLYTEHERKNRTLPIGLVLFMAGGTVALLAVLLQTS